MLKKVIAILVSFIFWGLLSTKTYADIAIIPITVDTYAQSGYPTVAAWNNRNFFIGYDQTYTKQRTRAYINFDSLMLKSIVQNNSDRIISATYRMYQYYYQTSNNYGTDFIEITTPWNQETLTWNNQPATGHLIGTLTIGNGTGWKEIDITQWIKEVIREEKPDYGFTIRGIDEYAMGGTFWSESCLNAPTPPVCNAGEQPHILLEYLPNKPPNAGTLISPQNMNRTNQHNIYFEWTKGADPDGDVIINYLQISYNPEFSYLIKNEKLNEKTEYILHLPEHTTYYARIRYSDGSLSTYSNTVEFEIYNSPPIPGKILFPQNSSNINKRDINIQWEAGEDEDNDTLEYTILISDKHDFTNLLIIENTGTETNYQTILIESTYYVKIRYFDGWEASFSEITTFTIYNTPPIAGTITSPTAPHVTNINEITFFYTEGVDKDGDEIQMKFQLSKDETFINYELIDINGNSYKHSFEEGIYFARILYTDNRDFSYSNTIPIVVKQEFEDIPILYPLTPIISDNMVHLQWDEIVNLNPYIKFEYRACSVHQSGTPNCTAWYTASEQTFEGLNEGNYSFWIEAKDNADNYSKVSNTVNLTIDRSVPKILNFTVKDTIISNNLNNNTQKIYANIDDITFKKWEIKIVDIKNIELATLRGYSPKVDAILELQGYEDGLYFTYIIAYDILDNKSISNIKSFKIDNTAPVFMHWINPNINNQVFINNPIDIEFKSEIGIKFEIQSNNEVLCSGITAEATKCTFELDNKNHQIVLLLRDNAENQSKQEISILVNTIKPDAPQITLQHVNKESITLKIKGVGKSYLLLNISGNNLDAIPIDEIYTEITLEYKLIPGIHYQLYGNLRNEHGKLSEYSNIVDIYIPLSSELGTGSSGEQIKYSSSRKRAVCKIAIHLDQRLINTLKCNIPAPTIDHMEFKKNKNPEYYDLKLYGVMFDHIYINIQYLKCKQYPWYIPKRFRTCGYENAGTEKITIEYPRRSLRLFNTQSSDVEWGFVSFGPAIGGTRYNYEHLIKKENLNSHKKVANFVSIEFKPQKINHWLSYYVIGNKSKSFPLPKVEDIQKSVSNSHEQKYSKYFDFVLDNYPIVTQWHGDTAFRKDHSGIDFGVKLKKIYAPADGIVRYAQWNEYDGECYQGGNAIRIEHDNGMHSVYFHLDDFKKEDGEKIKVNEKVERGQIIGTSGNTGYYNCKPLGYHLHFELRKTRDRATHVNPVPYVDVDWTKIKTIKNNKNALTGNNPHPKY